MTIRDILLFTNKERAIKSQDDINIDPSEDESPELNMNNFIMCHCSFYSKFSCP